MRPSSLIRVCVSLSGVFAAAFVPFDTLGLRKDSFLDQFDHASLEESGWIVSSGQKSDGSPYSGVWAIDESHKYPGFSGDKGLVMQTEAAFYAVSRKLPTAFDMTGDVVVQFEVKFQDGVSCGGAYIKLLTETGEAAHFSDATPFEVMFGPDICGSNSRVMFLVRWATGGEVVELRIRNLPMARDNPLSNLYTLVLRANHDVEIRINGEVAKAGNLFAANFMAPPLGEPEFVEDVDAQKPSDWDERLYVFDQSVSKPADWDQTYGAMWIADPSVRKPAGWNDEAEPEYICNPEAQKPQEWDDGEDGEWRAPMVRNPKCLYGCGEWKAPLIANPEYQGEWTPPQVLNPQFQGTWKRPQIANPAYSGQNTVELAPVHALGFEVWSMDAGIMFDNLYLGHLVEEAERIGNSTYVPKSEAEHQNYEVNRPKAKHGARKPPKTFDDILDDESDSFGEKVADFARTLIVYRYNDAMEFWAMFEANPVVAISTYPFKFACFCFVGLFVFTVVFGTINVAALLIMTSQPEETPKKPKPAVELTDEEIIAQITAQASGVQKSTTGAVKRKVHG